jgi:tetratricopeptide (TPR) repeat protein
MPDSTTDPSPARSNRINAPRLIAVALVGALTLLSGCSLDRASQTIAAREAAERARMSDMQAQSYVLAAEQSLRAGDKERALAEFARAIAINPTLTPAHMGVADIYRLDGDYAKAEEGYSRAAAIEPRNFDAQYYHGLMLHLLNRVTEAIQAYIRALAVKPDDFNANLNLSTAYYQLDENVQALTYGRRAVELNPRDGPARFNLGAVYAAMDNHAEAVKEYQQAAELMELNPPLLLGLAESLGRLERYEEMRNTLEQLVRNSPSAEAYERLGFAQFRLGRYDEALYAAALESFEKAVELDQNYYPALNGIGVSLLNVWIRSDHQDSEARARAIASLRRSLQLNRNQPQILELLTRYAG